MSLKDKLLVNNTMESRTLYEDLESYEFSIEGTTDRRYNGYSSQTLYELGLVCKVNFWANPVEYHLSLDIAKKQLYKTMYKDIECKLHDLKYNLWNNHKQEALKIIDELLEETKWRN